MKIIFLGTSSFGLPCLKALIKSEYEICCVVSRPARPAGRGKKLRHPPVAEYAYKNHLVIHQPEKLTGNFIENLRLMEPDLMVSAAYGGWLPEKLLESSSLGVINIHPSLLPEYRGAAPVTRAILDGREETGVSYMLTDSGWDTGPVIAVYREKILPDDTSGSLEERLSVKAAENIVSVIEEYSCGKLVPMNQAGEAVYAKKITTDETWLDWNRSAEYLERKVRAFQPFPGARTAYSGKTIKISAANVSEYTANPGEIVLREGAFLVGCGGETSLEIRRLQPASKRVMNADEYLRGARMKTGDRLERA
jgi:methionyl-tRNA formyltransferase